jgi:hypothetical protein
MQATVSTRKESSRIVYAKTGRSLILDTYVRTYQGAQYHVDYYYSLSLGLETIENLTWAGVCRILGEH